MTSEVFVSSFYVMRVHQLHQSMFDKCNLQSSSFDGIARAKLVKSSLWAVCRIQATRKVASGCVLHRNRQHSSQSSLLGCLSTVLNPEALQSGFWGDFFFGSCEF